MRVDFTGIWKANLNESRLVGPAPKSVLVTIKQSELELRQELLVTRLDGKEDRLIFNCWTNGERDKNLLNGKPLRGNARWEGDELAIESWIQAGAREIHFCDYWSLSSDGRTLIMEHRNDDLAGQRTVLDRVG